MRPEALLEFKRKFEEQRKRLIENNGLSSAEFAVSQDDLFDEVDLTTSELEQSMKIRLRNREALYLKKIESALQRIREGSFGECESCGEPIEYRRLLARPTTSHCVSCKEEQEHREMLHADGRKHKSIGKKLQLQLA